MTGAGGADRIDPAADLWPGANGQPVDCREKLRMLRANDAELTQVLRDGFEDAVLMGVDATALRAYLHSLVDQLQDPRRPPESQDAG
ncbi:hypothetical protein [Acidisoma sp. C75]